MRIGIDVSQIVYEGTGVARYTRNLVESLLAIDKENEYVLFGSSLRKKQELENWVDLFAKNPRVTKKIYSWPLSVLEIVWNRAHFFKIEKLIGKIDVFHTSDWLEPPSRAVKVTTVHDLVVYKYPESSHAKIVANQKRKLAWVKKESKLVICDSKATKNDLRDFLGFEEKKLKVIYPGVEQKFKMAGTLLKINVSRQTDKIQNVREKYKLSKDYILSVGTREPRKNLKGTIKAFKVLRRDFRGLELVLAGKFGWGNEIELVQGARVLGFVPDEDLPFLYAGAKCFLYPSFYEGFGLPVLEAMACGCPVVTSKQGSLLEVGGGAAIFVEPNNVESIVSGVKKVLSVNSKERLEVQEKGFVQVDRFRWEQTARETLAAYKAIGR